MDQPLQARDAKELLQKILDTGMVTYSIPHALERLKQRNISMIDCENVLRGGIVEEAELEKGNWRHRVHTQKIEVVVEFLSEDEVLVITAWRIK